MIDTSKYEGHSVAWGLDPDDWTWAINMFTAAGKTNEADALLIEDAPLLLGEVKRLREVAYRKDMQVGERDREIKRLREGIVNALIPTDTNPIIHPLTKLSDLRDALKELIE